MAESLKYLLIVLLVNLLDSIVDGTERRFDGYTVIRVNPNTEGKLHYLASLAEELDNDRRYYQRADFWKRPIAVNRTVDLMVAPEFRRTFVNAFNERELNPSVLIGDVEKLVALEKMSVRNASLLYARTRNRGGWLKQQRNAFFADYHRLNEIHDYMDELARTYSNRVSLETIGFSTERRELKAFRIGNPSTDGKSKPAIWMDGGIHAREWISPATVLFISTILARDADTDPDVKFLLDKYDFFILPSSNPDGYEYTHVSDRMWRKTRSRTGSAWDFVCRGVDPNRNWAFHWNEAGSSNNPCSDIYAGRIAFSEPETKSMSDFINRIKDRAAMYISFHSYSQLALTPWGYTEDLPEAYPDMERRALEGTKALTAVYGTEYKVGSSTRVLYSAAGGSDDWAHGAAKIKYSYTLELRDTGDNGFVLPKEQIIPTGEETWQFVKTVSMAIAEEY